MNKIIRARLVTGENRDAALAMKVQPGQEDFIEPVAGCLAEAEQRSLWRPFLLYTQNRSGGKKKIFRSSVPVDRHRRPRVPGGGRQMPVPASWEPVGFSMVSRFGSGSRAEIWLDRLMINGAAQGCGYGHRAVRLMTARLFRIYHCSCVYLSHVPENERASALYLSAGYAYTGACDECGERIMKISRPEQA